MVSKLILYKTAADDTLELTSKSKLQTEANSFWGDLLDWNESLSLPFPT